MANSLSLDEDTVVDRISNLPSSLICHILSFLNTKEAIATSILSSRWKPLWILVPTLDLQDDCRQEPISFTHIVYRVLALHIAPLLRNFSLAWYSPCNSFHLDAWIHTTLARNVEQLRLEIYLNGQDGTEFYIGRRLSCHVAFIFVEQLWFWNYSVKLCSILLPFNSPASRLWVSVKFFIDPTTLSQCSYVAARSSKICHW